MYMLRTEIRKLGGLICFLFVMLAIQAQQYTVTGGNGVPYLLENPGNRIRVYLVYGMDNVEISYTSSSTNHQWYRYKQKALDREPVPCEQNGETSVVRNIEEDAGYYVEDPASGLNGWYGSLIIVNTLLMSKALQSKEIVTAFGWKVLRLSQLCIIIPRREIG